VRLTPALIVLPLLAISIPTHADRQELRGIMQHLADSVVRLIPIVSEKEFNADDFSQEAVTLKRYFDQAGPHFADQPVDTRINYDMLKERLDQVNRLTSDRGLLSARNLLSESMELCASCHIRDGMAKPGFGISRVKHLSEYQAAEFSYLSRDYDSALASYRNFLADKNADPYQRSQALDRMLSITAEVVGDLNVAGSVLKEVTLADQSEAFRVKQWQSVFQKLKGDSLVSPLSFTTTTAMDRFLTVDWPGLQSLMDWNEQQAYWMLIRRQLNILLQGASVTGEIPILLYWLAVADRSTHFQFFESPSRRYLERCIRDYSQHAYARKCFDEYELLMIVSYSGSAGVNVPDEVRKEIDELRQLLFSKD
jgi:hypothetical protein